MKQSERLMQGVRFADFRVDDAALADFEQKFMHEFHEATAQLATMGLVKFNSTVAVKEWFSLISGGTIDVSRGVGKEVYLRPEYFNTYPELQLFAKVKSMESLRRHIKTFWRTLDEQETKRNEGQLF